MQLGDVELNSGHLDAAIDEYHHMAIDDGFRTFIPYGKYCRRVRAPRQDGGGEALFWRKALRLVPHLTVKWFIAHAPNYPILFEGYRKAGVP